MSIGIWELLLVLVIVLILFGGSRLRNLGTDLGSAIRGFQNSMKEGAKPENSEETASGQNPQPQARLGDSATLSADPLTKEQQGDKV